MSTTWSTKIAGAASVSMLTLAALTATGSPAMASPAAEAVHGTVAAADGPTPPSGTPAHSKSGAITCTGGGNMAVSVRYLGEHDMWIKFATSGGRDAQITWVKVPAGTGIERTAFFESPYKGSITNVMFFKKSNVNPIKDVTMSCT